jgi:hypothetical protein
MPELQSAAMIWEAAPHNAFTDLARWRGRWYCAFREGPGHAGRAGKVRVLESSDGAAWSSAALVAERGVDLRDPKLQAEGRSGLALLMGGTLVKGGRPVSRRPRIARSPDGRTWSAPRPILEEGDWLWRATRLGGRSYGISYRLPSPRRWTLHLFSGRGDRYERFADLAVPGRPNEATLRFRSDGTAVSLVRRESGSGRAWIGTSPPPYRAWSWRECAERVGGPNFLVLPDGSMWAAARLWRRGRPLVSICRMTEDSLERVLDLPSGGDCGYPGMAYHRGLLWLSYYSSHEGKARVYLAKVRLEGDRPASRGR